MAAWNGDSTWNNEEEIVSEFISVFIPVVYEEFMKRLQESLEFLEDLMKNLQIWFKSQSKQFGKQPEWDISVENLYFIVIPIKNERNSIQHKQDLFIGSV